MKIKLIPIFLTNDQARLLLGSLTSRSWPDELTIDHIQATIITALNEYDPQPIEPLPIEPLPLDN